MVRRFRMNKWDKQQKQKNFTKQLMDMQLEKSNEKLRNSRQERWKDYVESLKEEGKTYPKKWLHNKPPRRRLV